MRHPLISAQLYGTPLLLHPDKAATIEAVFRSAQIGASLDFTATLVKAEPMAVAYAAERYRDKPYILTDKGVAVVPVLGTMVHRGSFLDSASGLTNYQRLENQFNALANDPDVKAVLLEMDTPGGQAAGVFDLAASLSKMGKPLWASVNENAHSAGYALAAVADRITLARTASAGSIGVIALHVDQSGKNAKDGYAYTAIHAGAKKAMGSPHAPLADDARTELQARVDTLYSHFIEHVAQARHLDPAAVRAQEAGTFMGQSAVDAGLADEVMSFNDTLAALEAHVSAKPVFPSAALQPRRQTTRSTAMSTPEATAETFTADQVAAQLAAARKEGADTMQSRIRDIQACEEATGRESLARHIAFNTAMSAEDAKALLSASPKEAVELVQGNALAAAMGKLTNPAVGVDSAVVDADPQAQSAALWSHSNNKLRAVK